MKMKRRCIYCRKAENDCRSLHSFPLQNPELSTIWKEKINLPSSFKPTKSTRICSDHFAKKCFKTVKCGRILLPKSIPTFFAEQKRVVCFHCNNTRNSNRGIFLWRFPLRKPTLLRRWLKQINMEHFVPDRNSFVCSNHFEESCFVKADDGKKIMLKIDAVPTIFKEENEPSIFTKQFPNRTLGSLTNFHWSDSSQYACKNCDAFRETINHLQTKINNAEKREIQLKKRIQSLELELEQKSLRASHINSSLSKILSENQVQKLWSPATTQQQQHQNWSDDEIVKSIALYSASEKLYKHFKNNNFPLPALEILQNWMRKCELFPGILQPVIRFLQSGTDDLSEDQKACVLFFDKIEIKQSYSYDESTDETLATPTFVLLGLLRGLTSAWEQPIYYSFDTKLTWVLLKNILNAFKDSGFTIAALVFEELGGENKELIVNLQITTEQPWFLHNTNKIFVFSDPPNLLKTFINYYFSHGFIINKKVIKKHIISKLLSISNKKSENDEQPIVHGHEEEMDKKDAINFSQSIANVMSTAAKLGIIEEDNWEQCYKMFKTTSDWFDVMNVTGASISQSNEGIAAYGQNLKSQDKVLDKMTTLVTNMRVIGQKWYLPFQKEIMQNNIALKLLSKHLNVRFGSCYVLTSQLNMDAIENTFDLLGTKRGFLMLPDREDFRLRLTAHILGNNGLGKCNETSDSQTTLTASILENFPWPKDCHNNNSGTETDFNTLDSVDLENLARYILQKLSTEIKTDEHSLLVYNQSDGELSKPSSTMMRHLTYLNKIFKSFNKDDLVICPRYQRKLFDLAKNVHCHKDIKKHFFRARMYWRINTLNRKISIPSNASKRKYSEMST